MRYQALIRHTYSCINSYFSHSFEIKLRIAKFQFIVLNLNNDDFRSAVSFVKSIIICKCANEWAHWCVCRNPHVLIHRCQDIVHRHLSCDFATKRSILNRISPFLLEKRNSLSCAFTSLMPSRIFVNATCFFFM